MTALEQTPDIVLWTRRLEQLAALDAPVRLIEPGIRRAFGTEPRGSILRGDWLGHALHPALTDVVLGSWTSATVLDLIGGRDSDVAARRLVAVGLLAAGPTAWTGWAQWLEAGPEAKRVGLVHAVSNGLAVGTYAASWKARRRGQRAKGAGLALAGAAISSLGAYLGAHLTVARDVGTRDPVFTPADAPASR